MMTKAATTLLIEIHQMIKAAGVPGMQVTNVRMGMIYWRVYIEVDTWISPMPQDIPVTDSNNALALRIVTLCPRLFFGGWFPSMKAGIMIGEFYLDVDQHSTRLAKRIHKLHSAVHMPFGLSTARGDVSYQGVRWTARINERDAAQVGNTPKQIRRLALQHALTNYRADKMLVDNWQRTQRESLAGC